MRRLVGKVLGWFLIAAYPRSVRKFKQTVKEVDLLKRKRDNSGKFIK